MENITVNEKVNEFIKKYRLKMTPYPHSVGYKVEMSVGTLEKFYIQSTANLLSEIQKLKDEIKELKRA